MIEGRIDRYQHRVRSTSLQGEATSQSRFGLSAVSSLVKLARDAALPGPLQTDVALRAARNERESFQVAILPFGEDLRDIRVEATALTGPGRATIPRESIEISLVEYVKIDWDSDYATDRRGWWPDPLVPLRGPFSVPGGVSCQPLWVTLHVPPGTPPGDYRGTITVQAADAAAATLAVKLHVWDFELPREGHLKTHTWDEVEPLARFYNLDAYPVEWYLRLCDLLLKNRLNPGFAGVNYAPREPAPDGSYDFRATERVLQHCLDRGLTRFSVLQMRKGRYTADEAARTYAFVGAYADFLRKKGWLDRALVELWDEPLLHEWPDVKARAEKIRDVAPGLKVQLFANLSEGPYAFWTEEARRFGADRLIDIWAPIPPIEAPELQARGGEIWTYFCTLARGTAPNLYIDRPAVYQRTIGWHSFMYNVDGFEHWSVDSFAPEHPSRPAALREVAARPLGRPLVPRLQRRGTARVPGRGRRALAVAPARGLPRQHGGLRVPLPPPRARRPRRPRGGRGRAREDPPVARARAVPAGEVPPGRPDDPRGHHPPPRPAGALPGRTGRDRGGHRAPAGRGRRRAREASDRPLNLHPTDTGALSGGRMR